MMEILSSKIGKEWANRLRLAIAYAMKHAQDTRSQRLICQNMPASRNGYALTQPVSFALHAGDYIQLRGPNGSGKSTLLRQIAGLVPHDEGQLFIHDKVMSPSQIPLHLQISYLGHADGLHPDLTGYENFELLSGDGRDSLVQTSVYDRPVSSYSAGQRQLLCIHLLQDDHDLWLLDEAATSLDDKNRHHLEERIAGFLAIGGAVIASTHSDLAQNLVSQIITLEKRDVS